MYWAEKEVPSLELCKKLKKMGYPQDEDNSKFFWGGFWWVTTLTQDWHISFGLNVEWAEENRGNYIKAPTCHELEEWLIKKPVIAELGKLYIEYDEALKWIICYGKAGKQCIMDDIKINAYAKMVIWLKENEYINFNKGD